LANIIWPILSGQYYLVNITAYTGL
jgi:hypothetical protein